METKPLASIAVHEQSTDIELFLAIQAQQVKALDVLYERYGKVVYSTALRILTNIEAAEEVTQETFLRLWQRSDIYQPSRGTLGGFMITLARSKALDKLRAQKSRYQKIERLKSYSNQPLEHNPPLTFVTVEERAARVSEALQQLSPDERNLLEMAYYGGLSQSEIAERDSLPLGTVKSRTRQALKKLRNALTPLI
jgi:RNA polymerase sigma-70 factor, ECF subfamily